MAQYSSFFKSIAGDRTYSADKFAEVFRNLVNSGTIKTGTILKVEENAPNDLAVKVNIGNAIINGYSYSNTTALSLAIDTPHITYNRIDRIILRLDISDGVRSVIAAVLKGTPSVSPVAPTLEIDFAGTGKYEISLAQVLVETGVTAITNSKITDERTEAQYNLSYLTDQQLGTLINSLSAKTSLADNDAIVAMDSIDGNKAKKTTWANIKAALNALFVSLSTYSVIADNSNTANTLKVYNSNGGTIAEGRVSVGDQTNTTSLSMSVPSTGNTQSNLFGVARSAGAFIFSSVARALYIGTTATQDLIFGTNNTYRAKITSTGKPYLDDLKSTTTHPTNYKSVYVDTDTGLIYSQTSSGGAEVLKDMIVATGKSVTAQSLVEVINGGVKLASEGDSLRVSKPSIFNNGSTSESKAVMMTSNTVLIVFSDGKNSSYGTCCIARITENNIEIGPLVVFESANTSHIAVCALSSTYAIVVYQDGGNSNKGTACCITIGAIPIAGTPAVYENSSTTYNSVSTLSSSKAIVTYRRSDGYGTACILDCPVSTITPGTAAVFESASSNYTSVTMLTSAKAIVAYVDGGNSNLHTACVLDVSGSTITPSTPAVISSSTIGSISICSITSTKAVAAYSNSANSNYTTACVLNVAGSIITPATEFVFNSVSSEYSAIAMLSSTRMIAICKTPATTGSHVAFLIAESSNVLTLIAKRTFEKNNGLYGAITTISSTRAFVVNRDEAQYGKAKLIDVAPSNFVGVAKATKAAGETVSVAVGGIVGGFSSLTQGEYYYSQSDGTIGLVPTDKVTEPIGLAVSATELKLMNIA